jgi:hypothetical protein
MSALVPTSAQASWQWPADVLEFARSAGVEARLQPLLDATRQLFPTAWSLRVSVEDDPEIRDDRHIVLEAEVPAAAISDHVTVKRFWNEELLRICPPALSCTFRLILTPDPSFPFDLRAQRPAGPLRR